MQDVTDEVIENIATAYKENAPEFIYFYTLYNIFNEFLEDISEDILPNEATGFKNSQIWNMLYNFQKDAALAIINKLEKYNGCILADSVGLGKTFTALSVIKYYENRNRNVLVLCPKKLCGNWNTYKSNYINNPIEKDRLRYDVLFHTDLSRTGGQSNGMDLDRVNWGNYDLVVIDESHNFRNGGIVYGEDNKENRYLKLLHKVIRTGVKTKVLMLSATPVNNRFNDLKNQLALAYEGETENINNKLAIAKPIEEVFRNAQKVFNEWVKLDIKERTTSRLLSMLEFDFFEVLDSVTIARSRKHIQKYYNTADIGKFPERLKPISKRPHLTDLENEVNYNAIYKELSYLNLGIYTPTKYLHMSKIEKYKDLYAKEGKGLTQQGREEGIRKLMSINLLKRLESSVYAFYLTVQRIKNLIDTTIAKIEDYQKNPYNENYKFLAAESLSDFGTDFDDDDANLDDFTVGKKLKIDLRDIDHISWLRELKADAEILNTLEKMVANITPQHDTKLQTLFAQIDEKLQNSKNYIFVADNENGRIQRISRTDYKSISSLSASPNKPLLVAANMYDQLYVYDSSKTLTKYGYDLQKINGGTVNLSDYEVTQIAVGPDNALYFYDSVSQKIYRIKDNYTTVEEFCPLPAAITKISFALAGSTLYAANAKTIYPIDNNGNIISERTINIQNYSFVKLTGLAVDYEGNILISGEKNGSVINMYKIARVGKNSYSTAKKYSFKSNYFTLNYINGLVCDTSANLCYLVSGASTELDSANSVLFLNGLISTGNKTYDDFPETFDNITAAKVITETEFMAHLSNFEDVKTINEGTYVVVLANKVYGSTEYCYVCSFDSNGNSFGFIKKSHLEYKQGSAVIDSYKTVIPLTGDTITIFKTPVEAQNIGTFDNILYSDIDISIEVIDDVCNEEGTQIVLGGAKWYKVTYNGKTGYVTKYSILPFVQDDAVPIKSFAKVKADAIGLTVTLYAQPDEYSAILNFLTDGKKVQLCEQFDKNSKFTKIIADGTVGYVLTDNLILDGLTTGQIVAIIVTVVVAVIAIIILVITLVIKKKRKDNFL